MRIRAAFGVFVLFASLSTTVLAQSGAVTVNVANDATHGSYLVDGEGTPLYVFADDAEGQSTCTGACAEAWPPLLTDGEVAAGPGVAASLLSTIERPDGSQQVAYSGMPLYYFARDTVAGDPTGQGVNDVWFLVSNYGTAIVPPEPEEPVETEASDEPIDPMMLSQLQSEGNALYAQHCAACHGSNGAGVSGPPLDGGELSDDRSVIRQILRGSGHMPAFGSVLDDFDVAAVVTYIRTSWGNGFRPVAEEEVANYR